MNDLGKLDSGKTGVGQQRESWKSQTKKKVIREEEEWKKQKDVLGKEGKTAIEKRTGRRSKSEEKLGEKTMISSQQER